MKCPNCSFDIQDKIESCPFCNFTIPKPREAEEAAAPAASPLSLADEPLEESKHGVSSDPNDPLAAPAGYDDPYNEGSSPAAPAEEAHSYPPPSGGSGKPSQALILVVALAGAGGAYQFGLLDNLLITAGLKAAPAPAVDASAPASGGAAPAAASGTAANAAAGSAAGTSASGSASTASSGSKNDEPMGSPMPAAAKPAAAMAAPAESEETQEWRFYGRVFDMFTLEPLSGVEMSFMGGEGEEDITAKTDAKGQYKVALPALVEVIGYEIIIDKPGYHDGYVIDKDLNFKNLSPKARNQLITKAGKEKPWSAESSKWQRRDLGLFPAR